MVRLTGGNEGDELAHRPEGHTAEEENDESRTEPREGRKNHHHPPAPDFGREFVENQRVETGVLLTFQYSGCDGGDPQKGEHSDIKAEYVNISHIFIPKQELQAVSNNENENRTITAVFSNSAQPVGRAPENPASFHFLRATSEVQT